MTYSSTGMAGFTEKGPGEFSLGLGFVRGYRWWRWRVPARLLGYMASPPAKDWQKLYGAWGRAWEDGQQEATCTKAVRTWNDLLNDVPINEAHKVPEYRVRCGCGFWGYWPPEHPAAIGLSAGHQNLDSKEAHIDLSVFGSIKGYGRIIIGEKGFRSQFAEIESLCLSDKSKGKCLFWDGGTVQAENRAQRNLSVRDALLGRNGASVDVNFGSGFAEVNPGSVYTRKTEYASQSEVQARLARLEDELQKLYPSVTIVTEQALLSQIFPPDPTYGYRGQR